MQVRTLFAAIALAAALAGPARALDTNRGLDQYQHTGWTADLGAPEGIQALAQTPDGYLWIGATTGLYRFDGVNFEAVPGLAGRADDPGVTALYTSRAGDLWIGYASSRIGVLRGGRQIDASPGFFKRGVLQFAEDRAGGIWIRGQSWEAILGRYAGGRWRRYGAADGLELTSSNMTDIDARRDGSVWVALRGGFEVLRPGSRRFTKIDWPGPESKSLVEDSAGRLWLLGTKSGSRMIDGGSTAPPHIYSPIGPSNVRHGLFDRDGSLWGVTGSSGIFRLPNAPARRGVDERPEGGIEEKFGAAQGLTSDTTNAILEDREGNIWVGTSLGLDRFRDAAVFPERRIPQHSRFGYVIMSTRDGTVFAADSDSVYRVRAGGLPEKLASGFDNPESICEGLDGTIWLSTHGGIFRLAGNRFEHIPDPPFPKNSLLCTADTRGDIWFAQVGSGLLRLSGGVWSQQPLPATGPDEVLMTMLADTNGGLLLSIFHHGLVNLRPNGARMIWPYRDMPGGDVNVMTPIRDGLLMADGAGLVRLRGGRAERLPRDEPALRRLTGLVETPDGWTWALGQAGIVRVRTAALGEVFTGYPQALEITIFDRRDGIGSPPVFGSSINSAVMGGDGRLWFMTSDGLVKIDPARLPRNPLPPPVMIRRVVVDGRTYADPVRLCLPAGASQVEIGYTATSLSIPERVRFRYKLENVDRDWVDPGLRRAAFYTNLAPGRYVFRVIAANNDGVWNRQGARVDFEIAPAFWQTSLFKLLCTAAGALLLWAAYRARVRRITARLRERADQRLAERERIARDLHDTLLQGFQALVLRFQSVANLIPPGGAARARLDEALDVADAVLIDGRNSVRRLRSEPPADLAARLADLATRMRGDSAAAFRIVEEGTPRPLRSGVGDELTRIAGEAIVNAFRHAGAARIDVLIGYHPRGLRLGVYDDGHGIAAEILSRGGREGHFGLQGMRERAAEIGARLDVASTPGGGTKVSIMLPARTAYARARHPDTRRQSGELVSA